MKEALYNKTEFENGRKAAAKMYLSNLWKDRVVAPITGAWNRVRGRFR
jgi:hypothetical protein